MTSRRRSHSNRRTAGRAIVPGRRFVFDTAALVSAALRPSSATSHAFSLAVTSGVVCASETALKQLSTVLLRRSLDRYTARRTRAAFIDLLYRHAWICPSTDGRPQRKSSWRNRGYRAFVEFASAAEADALVTTAPIPRTRPSRRNLLILTPEEFLRRYAA
jgi:predicted nucleic acid-binding protein